MYPAPACVAYHGGVWSAAGVGWRWVVAAALTASSCARPVAPIARPASDWTAITVEDPLRVSDFVLVRAAAALHERPSDDSDFVVVGPSATSPADLSAPPNLFAFRFVEQRGDWVAIDTLINEGEQCYPVLEQLRGMRIRFYVRTADLALVTRREVEVRLPEGGTLALTRGVALVSDASTAGAYRWAYPETEHGLDAILEGSVPNTGRRKAPADLSEVAIHVPLESTGLHYGWDFDHHLPIYRWCAAFTGVAPPKPRPEGTPPKPHPEGKGSARHLSWNADWFRKPHEFAIRAGALAHWSSGWLAGTVVHKTNVGSEVDGTGSRRCFHTHLVGAEYTAEPDPRQGLRLCFPPDDVEAVRDPVRLCNEKRAVLVAEFGATVSEHNTCNESSECSVITPGCPFGCYVGVRAAAVAVVEGRTRELVSRQGSDCHCRYKCPAIPRASCVHGRCTIEATP